MNRLLLLVTFIFPFALQAQLSEDFTDGDFISNPVWAGDVSRWQVNNSELQSASAVANDTFYLSTVSSAVAGTQWELWMKLDFSTSGNNYVDVYLVSSQPDLKSSLNGYFVRIGGTPDEIALYRRDGLTSTKIIDGMDGRSQLSSSNNIFKIKTVCTSGNEWKLYDDPTGVGNNYFLEGAITDATYSTGDYFGFYIRQSTSSFFNKHFFDNIYVGAIIPDTVKPAISSVQVLSSATIDVKFSEALEQVSAEDILNYTVNNGIGNPVTSTRDATDFSLVHLAFTNAFVSGLGNTLTVNSVADLENNLIPANANINFTFYTPQPAAATDIIFNEVLFNAKSVGVEFVEIYNKSQKVIDLKMLQFAKEDLTTHQLTAPESISSSNFYLLPGEYLVLTDDSAKVRSQYVTHNTNAFLEMNLPDLLSSEDIIVLLDQSSLEIDKLHYYEDWQFPLLNSTDGVSLERISFFEPTDQQSNWHSASEQAGFATPGYQNSQFVKNENYGSEVTITPEIFSPDNDGKDDVMSLYFTFNEPGYVANVVVYDSRGRMVKKIADNLLLGTTGTIFWDGITVDNAKARTGIYVVYLEVFNESGDTKKFKRTCVLATKL